MIQEVFLLAFDAAVHDNGAGLAHDRAWILADGTHTEVGTHLIISTHLIRHEALVISHVRVSS